MCKLHVVRWNVLGAVQTITVKNPPTDQHGSALVPLGEDLGLRQPAHAQRCGYDWIRLNCELIKQSLASVKLIGLAELLIDLAN